MNTWILPALWLGPNPLMDIWRTFQLTAHHDDLIPITIVILGTAVVLAVFSRRQRVHVRAALVMYALALFLIVLSAIPERARMDVGGQSPSCRRTLIGGLCVGEARQHHHLRRRPVPHSPFPTPGAARPHGGRGIHGSRTVAALAQWSDALQHRCHLRRHDRSDRFFAAR